MLVMPVAGTLFYQTAIDPSVWDSVPIGRMQLPRAIQVIWPRPNEPSVGCCDRALLGLVQDDAGIRFDMDDIVLNPLSARCFECRIDRIASPVRKHSVSFIIQKMAEFRETKFLWGSALIIWWAF